MISLSELEILKDKPIYDTNNDTYVVYEDKETVLSTAEFKLLGFQNGYSYSNSSGYLMKGTLYGAPVHEIVLDVDHGVFKEGFSYMFFYKDMTMYKVNEMMEIEWSIDFDDYIRQIILDNNGNTYILFCNSRSIRKYDKQGNLKYYMDDSDDPYHYCRLYCGYISEGGGHLYVTGVDFFDDDKYIAYVDHYDTRKCKRIERMVKNYYSYGEGVERDDPRYTYSDMCVDGDYLYLYGRSYIEKYNIKMRLIWRFYPYGFDSIGSLNNLYSDSFHEVVFDNRKFKDRIYFCSSIDVNKRNCSFGKLTTNGQLKWEITDKSDNPITNVEFNVCIYNDEIYVTSKKDVDAKKSYLLALDDNNVLLETRNNELIRVVQHNTEELYASENYNGYYTIGDDLKDGVPKKITVAIMHDTGKIMVDENHPLVYDDDYPYWKNPDNYWHFKLYGTQAIDRVNENSLIMTRYGTFLMTKFGTYIRTRYAYEPDQDIQYIVDDEEKKLTTKQDFHLIRNKTVGVINFYLLNDEYKFGQDIITKRDNKIIITKDKHHSIIRKKRYVYRYTIRRLLDIDIIVEYLKENGILETMLPQYVDKLRHHTTHMIEDMQTCLSPTLFNIEAQKRYSYKYDGYDYPIRFIDTQIFMCNNIPYIKKRKSRSLFIEPMAQLVANEEVQPFLLFLGGKVIKWSDMTIVRDWQFSYIILNNTPENDERIDAVLFPCVIRYGEDNKILPNTPHLYFNSERLLTENTDDVSIRIEITDSAVDGHTIISEGNVLEDPGDLSTSHDTIIEVPTRDYDQWSNSNNLFVFSPDGSFFPDSRFYLTNYSKNMYSYEFDEKGVTYKTFYFIKANDSKGMIYNIPNQSQVKEDLMKKYIPSNSIPEDSFKVPFDFRLSRDKSYLTNISEATRYILGYNMGLLVDFYRDQSNIKAYTYTGEKILFISANNNGYIKMPRQRNNGLFDYVIMFVNDNLYDYYHEITYSKNYFIIPIFDHVRRSDKVEIVHFKNVNNVYSKMTVNAEPDYIGELLRYDNFLLFGNSESGKVSYDTFDPEQCDQYPIPFDYKNNFNEYGKYINTSIKLEDFYYYNRSINIVSKRQFRSMYYNVLVNSQSEFDLDPTFRFCHNTNQYLVFVNGIKLNQTDWTIIYPTHELPRERITIRLDEPIHKGDIIDIIYIPDPYEEIILERYTNRFGDIILDVSKLDYSFDNELFLIFIDGHKVIKDDIQNISANRVRIKTNYPEWSDVCICKYLNPDRILYKVFSYGDIWTKSVNGLSQEDYEQLFIKSGIKK